MADEEKMSIEERYKYLRKMQKRYKGSKREERSRLLDEMEAVTGRHRKSLVRDMGVELKRKTRRGKRKPRYGNEVARVIVRVAESMDWVCPERLTPNLVWMSKQLARHGEIELTEEVEEQLGDISISTVGRILSRYPRERARLPRQGPERANQLARQIPAGRIAWNEPEPGHFEVDLVHHCGSSSSGLYVHTLQMVDVATGWSERVAILGRSYRVMKDGFERILARLPFPVLEIHPDNGSEFLNDHLVRFWKDKVTGIHLSRSRPYHKNDNRFVEQKNDTLVRACIGYERLDTVEQTNLLNQVYGQMWLYYHFFQPVMRLEEKVAVTDPSSSSTHIQRHYDQARTPFDRLAASGVLDPQQQACLKALFLATNPCLLHKTIYSQLDQLWALPVSPPGVSQNVFLTLFNQSEAEDHERQTYVA